MREPEALAAEWINCLLADGIWKNPAGKAREVVELIARMHLRYERVQMSQAFMVEATGASRSTVQRVVRALDKAGIQRRKLSRPEIDPDTKQFVSRETTRYVLCDRAKRRGYRSEDRRRALNNACKRGKNDSRSYASNLTQELSSSRVNTPLVVVGPSSEPTQQLPSREKAREIFNRARLEGRSQRRE
jgi:hypothetical protein